MSALPQADTNAAPRGPAETKASVVTPIRPAGIEIVGRSYAFVPPGQYLLQFLRHETFLAFRGSPKLALWFAVADPGAHFATELPRFYNVKALTAKPRRGGAFKAGRSSNLVLDLCELFPEHIRRLDRLSLDPFRQHGVIGHVETVAANSAQRTLPAALAYSVIRRFERFRP
jgi:hypothetical protein